ncbi:hypothetical protein [Pantoea ananatis]|uniref:hypothetical protein n=1 Tax=Pantoea ananas TaxID=553 RepID=UPI000D6C84CB|nr:hypothetical protein [Pantoea ananatis]PWK10440.1 hypothetical protein C7421_10297 [Pantoea ananatis]
MYKKHSIVFIFSLLSISYSFAKDTLVVKDVDKAPLLLACNEKKSSPKINDNDLVAVLKREYSVSKSQAKRVVEMLNTIPDLPKIDCNNVDTEYNAAHR